MPKYGPIRTQVMDWNNPMLRNALLKAEAGGPGRNKLAETQAIRSHFIANESTRLGKLQAFGNQMELRKQRFGQQQKIADHQVAMGKARLEMDKDKLESMKKGSDLAMYVGLTGVGLQALDNRQAKEKDKLIQREKFNTTYAMLNSFNPASARQFAMRNWETGGSGKYQDMKWKDSDLSSFKGYYNTAMSVGGLNARPIEEDFQHGHR